jgi:hypothetical protein
MNNQALAKCQMSSSTSDSTYTSDNLTQDTYQRGVGDSDQTLGKNEEEIMKYMESLLKNKEAILKNS